MASRAYERQKRGWDDARRDAFVDGLWWSGDLLLELAWAGVRLAVHAVVLIADL
jgi:hypothetical protein